ncbi:hypothetical protein B1B07_00030 [Kocuria marina subsp. indica]|nr:hypothetical protein B1B07_00030 [Kocuria indica]
MRHRAGRHGSRGARRALRSRARRPGEPGHRPGPRSPRPGDPGPRDHHVARSRPHACRPDVHSRPHDGPGHHARPDARSRPHACRSDDRSRPVPHHERRRADRVDRRHGGSRLAGHHSCARYRARRNSPPARPGPGSRCERRRRMNGVRCRLGRRNRPDLRDGPPSPRGTRSDRSHGDPCPDDRRRPGRTGGLPHRGMNRARHGPTGRRGHPRRVDDRNDRGNRAVQIRSRGVSYCGLRPWCGGGIWHRRMFSKSILQTVRGALPTPWTGRSRHSNGPRRDDPRAE